MKKTIKKSEIRKLVKENLSAFYMDAKPFGVVGAGRLSDALKDAEQVEVNDTELEMAISETIKGLERNAKVRMQAEAAGVKSAGMLNESISESNQETIKKMETLVRDALGLKSLVKIESMGGGRMLYVFSNPKEGKMIAKHFKKRGHLEKTIPVRGDRFGVIMKA